MITIELTWWSEDMEEETTYEFPAINEVCSECDGEGFVLVEGMRGHAYSQEEFNEAFDDDEDRQAYFTRGSKYDTTCPVCRGKNVVPVVAENLLNDKEKVLYAEYQKCEERIAREEAADRATFRAENGYIE
jgi:RecJ-like exonuclease